MSSYPQNCKNCHESIPIDHAQVGGVHMTCEHEYFHKKKTYWQIWVDGLENNKCTVEPGALEGTLEDADYFYCVQPKQMTKAEFDLMPEFTGF
jgi:hypothetical protein